MGQVGTSWSRGTSGTRRGGLQILVGQVEQGEGGLEIFVGQVGQGQGVCPFELFRLSQMGLQGHAIFHGTVRSGFRVSGVFYSSFVCISAYANVYFKTKIIKQNMQTILIAGVPSSQALLGFLITAPPSVCVPGVIGVLAVWIPQKKRGVAGTFGHLGIPGNRTGWD